MLSCESMRPSYDGMYRMVDSLAKPWTMRVATMAKVTAQGK
jgi:hypothetical protein